MRVMMRRFTSITRCGIGWVVNGELPRRRRRRTIGDTDAPAFRLYWPARAAGLAYNRRCVGGAGVWQRDKTAISEKGVQTRSRRRWW